MIVVNINTGQPIYRSKDHSPSCVSSVYPVRNQEMISCSYDGTVRLWDLRVGSSIKTLNSSRAPVTCLSIMGENDSIITSGSADGEVRLWDLRFDSFNPSLFLSGHNNRITGLTPLVIIILLYIFFFIRRFFFPIE